MPQFKNSVRPVVLFAYMGQLLPKLSIIDMYVYFIFVEHLCYKVLLLCFCRLFGGNILLILTNFPYNSNFAIQGGCQLLLKLSIADFYAYGIFIEYLCYKVLLFCLCRLFGDNSSFIFPTLSYNINSANQGICLLLLKLYIRGPHQDFSDFLYLGSTNEIDEFYSTFNCMRCNGVIEWY